MIFAIASLSCDEFIYDDLLIYCLPPLDEIWLSEPES